MKIEAQTGPGTAIQIKIIHYCMDCPCDPYTEGTMFIAALQPFLSDDFLKGMKQGLQTLNIEKKEKPNNDF